MLEPPLRLRSSIISGNLNLTKKIVGRFPYLIEDIDPTNGWTPLHYASYHGHYLIVVFLLSLMVNLDELEGIPKTFIKETPMHLCCYKGHEQVLHLLLQHYPQHMNSGGGENLMTPLHICAKYDYFKCIELLVGLNVDVNSKDSGSETPLHYAMKFGNLNSIKLLINNNADFTVYSSKKLKPVDMANSFEVEKYYKKLVDYSSQRRSTVSSSVSSTQNSPLDSQNAKSPYQHTFSPGDDLSNHQQNLYRHHSNSLPPLPSVSTVRKNSIIPQANSPRTFSTSNKPSRKLPPIHTANAFTSYPQGNERSLPSPRVRTPVSSVSYTFQTVDSAPSSAYEQRSSHISSMFPNMASYHLIERETTAPTQPALQLPSIKSTTSLKQQNTSNSSQAFHQRRRSSISDRESMYDLYSIGTPSNRSRSSTITSLNLQRSVSSSLQQQQPSSPGMITPLRSHASGGQSQSLSQNTLTKIRSNSSGSKLSVISRTSTPTSSDSNSPGFQQKDFQNIGRISSPTLQDFETSSSSLVRKETNSTVLNSFGINQDMRQKYVSSGTPTYHLNHQNYDAGSLNSPNTRRDSLSTIESEGVTERNSRLLARSYSSGGMRSVSSGNGTAASGLGRKILNINISSLGSRRGH
ncbi:hypothetical protein WICPIJ_004241 [Wickerhamomyces pijperi]|uniref:Uncharacterized protein n=1 Tax=Wickerhamomyces pijperi TaxID=599730 RepID=A0A9P8Q823_WICPI|nr:hypothetical protein WICPIJ_004241 [Wickerhamomyces pijperi]